MGQALDSSPPSFCSYCEEFTAHDGWGTSVDNGRIETLIAIYCDQCGKHKCSIPFDDVGEDLRQEILDLLNATE